MKRIAVIFIGLFILNTGVFAQKNEVSTYILDLYQTWDSTYSNYAISHIEGDTLAGIDLIQKNPIRLENDTSNSLDLAQLKQEVLLQEANFIKGDIGLGVSGSYVYNLDPGIGFEDNLFYDQKFRASVGMDLLSSGFFANQNKAKVKYNELEIMRLQAPESNKHLERYLKWHNIIYQFNLKKIKVLKTREALAKNRVSMATKLNYLKYVSQKDLITTISSHAEIISMLNIYESYNQQLASELRVKDQSHLDYPLFDIDYTYSYKLMTSEEPDSVAALLLENIQLNDKAIHDFRLRPFVAFNFFDLVSADPAYRNYFSVGLTVAAPLNFNAKNRSNLKEAKSNIAMMPAASEPEVQEDILTQFYEFRYKLKQYSTLYQKRKMYSELIRRERVKHDIAPLSFNPMEALHLLDNMMQIDIELIDLKQQMYLKILNIYTDLPYSQANKLIKPIDLDNAPEKNKRQNSIYIWSSSILKYEPEVIAHYIQLNPFKRATISLNQNKEARVKLNTLIDILNKDGVEVELMIGKNKLINGGFTTYMQTLGEGVDWSKISAIHLDVEPHVNKDWHENKASYLIKYHALIAEASSFCKANNIKLGVSIPTHYPEDDIRKIFDSVDRVYFMCYENVKTDFIARKTNKYDSSKTYIALRTNDFENRLEMENKFSELVPLVKVAGFVVHDFGSLMEFDINSIK
jgi:hypothetical protein